MSNPLFTLGVGQGEHPLHVPRHGDEGPLTLDIFEPTQQELAEAHHRFDDPEHCASFAKRFSRRANSSGIDMPSGTSA